MELPKSFLLVPTSGVRLVFPVGAGPDAVAALETESLHPAAQHRLKRWLDMAVALIGLLAAALVLIPVALAVWVDSPGPVFCSQVRYGLRGQPFRSWQFRSTVQDANMLQALAHSQAQKRLFHQADPRITRVGRLLRRTGLSQLPCFWNILRGDMSLVGVHSPGQEDIHAYELHHWQPLRARPGLVGLWQKQLGSQHWEETIAWDVQYLQRWSLGYDLQILLAAVHRLFWDRRN